MLRTCLYLLIMLLVAGCDLVEGLSSSSSLHDNQEEVEPIVLDDLIEPGEYKIDPYSVIAVAGVDTPFTNTRIPLETDTLVFRVAYPGGCKERDFQLIGAGDTFMESYPVQYDVILVHNAGGDDCDEQVIHELHFDLSPLKKHFQYLYKRESGIFFASRWEKKNV